MKHLQTIQTEVAAWSVDNFGAQESKATGQRLGSLAPLLGIVEEVGELVHATLKHHQGIRGFDHWPTYTAARDDALGDVLIYLCDYASREGIDLLALLNKTWEQIVSKRDWKKDPKEGNQWRVKDCHFARRFPGGLTIFQICSKCGGRYLPGPGQEESTYLEGLCPDCQPTLEEHRTYVRVGSELRLYMVCLRCGYQYLPNSKQGQEVHTTGHCPKCNKAKAALLQASRGSERKESDVNSIEKEE